MHNLPEPLRDIPVDVPGLWETLATRFAVTRAPPSAWLSTAATARTTWATTRCFTSFAAGCSTTFPNAEIHVVCHGPERVVARYRDDPVGPVTSSHFKSRRDRASRARSDLYIIGGGGIVNRINAYSGNMVFKALDPKGKFQFLATLVAGLDRRFTLYYAHRRRELPGPRSSRASPASRSSAPSVVSRARPADHREPARVAASTRDIVQVLDPALSLDPADPARSRRAPARVRRHAAREPRAPAGRRQLPLGGRSGRRQRPHARRGGAPARVRCTTAATTCIFLPISQHPDKHLEDDLDFGRRLRDELERAGAGSPARDVPAPDGDTWRCSARATRSCCRGCTPSSSATMMGVPIAVVSYDDKVTEFVKLAGRESRMIQLTDFSIERLAPALDDVLAEVPVK